MCWRLTLIKSTVWAVWSQMYSAQDQKTKGYSPHFKTTTRSFFFEPMGASNLPHFFLPPCCRWNNLHVGLLPLFLSPFHTRAPLLLSSWLNWPWRRCGRFITLAVSLTPKPKKPNAVPFANETNGVFLSNHGIQLLVLIGEWNGEWTLFILVSIIGTTRCSLCRIENEQRVLEKERIWCRSNRNKAAFNRLFHWWRTGVVNERADAVCFNFDETNDTRPLVSSGSQLNPACL